MNELVLSLFPGIGILDKGFEEAGFCIVRGPDLIWGGDIRKFHPPVDVFHGVIGGPPCQEFSSDGNRKHLLRKTTSRSWAELRRSLELQGLPGDYFGDLPYRVEAAHSLIGNAVALPMARELARAVRQALAADTAEEA